MIAPIYVYKEGTSVPACQANNLFGFHICPPPKFQCVHSILNISSPNQKQMYPTILIENRAKSAQHTKNTGPIFFVPTRLRSPKPLGTHGPSFSGVRNSVPSHLFHQDVTKEMKKVKELSLRLLQNVMRKTVAFFYSLKECISFLLQLVLL